MPHQRISRRTFLGGAATAGLVMMHPFAARAAGAQVHLRLIETTDIHVGIFPYDYYADKPNDTFGLGRTAALIDGARAEAVNSLLIDNGDLIQGNPMGDYVAFERGLKQAPHPVFLAMNTLGYEVSTLGNHEFNYGLDFLSQSLAGADFPFVCANLVDGTALAASPRGDKTFLKPYRIVEKQVKDADGAMQTIKVGFIGFVPPQIMVWDEKNLAGKVRTRDIVSTAKAYVPQMKEEGADLIVALSHSGIDDSGDAEGMENASLYVAGVPGIDIVLTGHQHLVFPGPDFQGIKGADLTRGTLQGKPAVMAGFWGSHMGLIDLLLEHDGANWTILSHTSEARPIYKRESGKVTALVGTVDSVVRPVQADHDATLAYVRRPVGKTAAPLHSYFALVADDPSVQVVNQAQSWYLREMLKGGPFETLPLLSAAAPFKSGGRNGPDYYTDVAPGDIAIKNVADLYLYPNTIRAVKITGATVKEWLEMSAGIFLRIDPGKADQKLIDPGFPSYNFDVLDGITYEIDPSQPARYDKDGKPIDAAANRIVDLAYDGQPVDPAQEFIVATNNYRAGGGGNFPGISNAVVVFVGPDTNRDLLVRYIHEQGTINPTADGNWRLKRLPGTTALFESGPGARAHLTDVKGADIAYVGEAAAGFASYRITL